MQLLADQLTAPTRQPPAPWGLTTTNQGQQPLSSGPPQTTAHSIMAFHMLSRAMEQPLVHVRHLSWLHPASAPHHRGGSPGCAPLTQQQTKHWLKPGQKTGLRFFSVWGRHEKKKKEEDDARLRRLTVAYTAYVFVSTARDNSVVFFPDVRSMGKSS